MTLTDLDAWTIGRVVVLAGFYVSALLAVGGMLFRFAFTTLPPREIDVLDRCTCISAWCGVGMLLLLWLLQAAYLGGGNWSSAFNPVLLGIVGESAQGERLRLAILGLLLLPVALWHGIPLAVRYVVSVLGIGLVLVGFAQVGHTRGSPWQSALLMLHLSLAAFWAAALLPLYRLARSGSPDESARLLLRFGRFGLLLVPLLLIAGGSLAQWLLGGRPNALLDTSYGQALAVKLTLVLLLLLLGAANRWWLVPAVARGEPKAPGRLSRSIVLEAILMLLIVLVAALLLTTASPAR
ncbi:CopD family protein [Halomonas sp. LR3S48]|uniref:CopD family protein n=1 Tax=Halomonas sp. LR3S48 TaxID=2982694 RepID=UPI0021E3E528|nr:CopD family protein [Halomonas sp. LR3S48]UYG03057.1 CopD family protein [Halomonas sp. LR3S48]